MAIEFKYVRYYDPIEVLAEGEKSYPSHTDIRYRS